MQLPSTFDYVYRPGIDSRCFAIVIETIEMYSLDKHAFSNVVTIDSGMVFTEIEIYIGKH